MTSDFEESARKKTALKVTISTIAASMVIYFIGNQIFYLFGITINSFRIGTGALLFLSAYSLVKGGEKVHLSEEEQDIAVVPLSIPVAIGPATTGTILVMGSEGNSILEKSVGLSALILAIIAMGAFLFICVYTLVKKPKNFSYFFFKIASVTFSKINSSAYLSISFIF
jgi:multiple antibiotic resistance protein